MTLKFKIIAKFIYRLGIALVLFPIIGIIFSFLPIEFVSCDLNEYFQILAWFSLPIGILLTIFKLFGEEENYLSYKIRVIIIKTLISLGLFYCMINTELAFLVSYSNYWTNYSILYENKENPKTKIVDQVYDHSHRIIKIVQIVPGLIYTKKTDTTFIDKTIWKPVHLNGKE